MSDCEALPITADFLLFRGPKTSQATLYRLQYKF